MISLSQLPEFDDHKYVIAFNDNKSNLKGFISIHRGNIDTPSFGATRFWEYQSEDAALRDSLRLGKMMSYKSALAGLKYGGAKAVIMKPQEFEKEELLEAYGRVITDLQGQFITGTDVGLNQEDLKSMDTEYLVGKKGDPTEFTALGLLHAVQAALKHTFSSEELTDRSFAIQGLGKIGSELINLIEPYSHNIIATDINEDRVSEIKNKFPFVTMVSPEDIHKQNTDIFCPCALSSSINAVTLPDLQCKAIVGGANNQLEHGTIGDKLHQNGILYAPDFIVNAGGLISVVDEYENEDHQPARVITKVSRIKTTIDDIFQQSKELDLPPSIIANRMAESILQAY